jgi:hypothetical protein
LKLKSLSIAIGISLWIAPQAWAIVTRDCPDTLTLSFSGPQIEKSYAVEAYKSYFEKKESVGGTFILKTKVDATCRYEPIGQNETPIYQVILRGTLEKKSDNPAVMISYMILPMKGFTEFDIGDAIVYTPLARVSVDRGLKAKNTPSQLYYQAADCEENGPCVSRHVYLGTFDITEIE